MRRLPIPVLTLLIVVSVLFGLGRFFLLPFSNPRPDDLGVVNGHLHPCADHVNCVSGEISYTGSYNEARDRLLAIIGEHEGATLITNEAHYIYVEFRSGIWGFVDDVEFYFPHFTRNLHYRSLSRLGRNDHEANRARIDAIIEAFLSDD